MKKIAIEKLCIKSQERKQFWTNILSVENRDKNSRPVINLKKKKKFILYSHFKIESLLSVKDFLKMHKFMCNFGLKDAYFCIPLSEESKKQMKFYWQNKLYQFLFYCFGLASTPYIFITF